jgi:site-specific recombinase XerD
MPIEEVSKMLGHSSIETTMIYAEVNREKLKTDHEKYVV